LNAISFHYLDLRADTPLLVDEGSQLGSPWENVQASDAEFEGATPEPPPPADTVPVSQVWRGYGAATQPFPPSPPKPPEAQKQPGSPKGEEKDTTSPRAGKRGWGWLLGQGYSSSSEDEKVGEAPEVKRAAVGKGALEVEELHSVMDGVTATNSLPYSHPYRTLSPQPSTTSR